MLSRIQRNIGTSVIVLHFHSACKGTTKIACMQIFLTFFRQIGYFRAFLSVLASYNPCRFVKNLGKRDLHKGSFFHVRVGDGEFRRG